jgi:hypothetical protein
LADLKVVLSAAWMADLMVAWKADKKAVSMDDLMVA